MALTSSNPNAELPVKPSVEMFQVQSHSDLNVGFEVVLTFPTESFILILKV